VKYIILKLKEEIRSVGLLGFIGLQRRFRAIDRDNTKSLSLSDFKKVLQHLKVNEIVHYNRLFDISSHFHHAISSPLRL
jgi:hypothetical protein